MCFALRCIAFKSYQVYPALGILLTSNGHFAVTYLGCVIDVCVQEEANHVKAALQNQQASYNVPIYLLAFAIKLPWQLTQLTECCRAFFWFGW